MRMLSDMFKALSDETRVRMLALMARRGELCVCDFVEALGITQSKASRHLRYLANTGLAADRRDAVWVFYRLPDAPPPEVHVLLTALRPVLASQDLRAVEARLDTWLACKGKPPACRKNVAPAISAH